MKRLIKNAEYELTCDKCNCLMEFETIEIVFSYPHHQFDGTHFYFCCNNCLKEWVKENLDNASKRD